MSKNKNKPIKSFEIVVLGEWYFVEIYSSTNIEVYTENSDIQQENIQKLIKYLKTEGFLELEGLI